MIVIKSIRLTVICLLFFFSLSSNALRAESSVTVLHSEAELREFASMHEIESIGIVQDDSPNPSFRTLFKIRNGKGKSKVVAVVLAFPLTGITGIHRVYLGTAPFVPVVYMLSLGGCVGILPFIDFVVILAENDLSKYEDNRKIFMWMK